MARVYIPTCLRKLTGGQAYVRVPAGDVAGLLDELDGQFPGLKREVVDARGDVHRFVNVYVNEQAIEDLRGLDTPLQEQDEVMVIPAMAGGATTLQRPFTLEQAQRYARHIIMPQVGRVGQRKLFDAKVVLIGAGGLGSPSRCTWPRPASARWDRRLRRRRPLEPAAPDPARPRAHRPAEGRVGASDADRRQPRRQGGRAPRGD